MKKQVLFLVPYPLHKAPSQRFRVEAFLPLLQKNNITYSIEPFLDAHTFQILYKDSSIIKKAIGVVKGFLRRWVVVILYIYRYEFIFIHREVAPVGLPIFEWVIAKIWRRKIIYDFDDAIWLPNTTKENKIIKWVKAFWKVKFLCKWSYKVVGGNEFLCSYAKLYNKNVILIPTTVDVLNRHNQLKDQNTGKIIIGWTGTHSTMKYLNPIVPVLKRLSSEFDLSFIVISNKVPDFFLPNLHYIPWSETTEINDLLLLNIGLMPLEKDAWSEGKCGFKLIQYMALGIPCVASPVGVNNIIIEQEVDGYLCTTEEQWYSAIKKLISDISLRKTMGERGRRKVIDNYSVQANTDVFLDLFT